MTTFDQIAADLQARRADAGSPSYAEIALRIAKLRELRGGPDALSRPARTTVYDAFRAGRRRMDTALVLDIVRALGAGEDEVAQWAERCRTAHAGEAPAPSVPEPEPEPEPEVEADPPPPPAPPTLKAALILCLGCLALNLVGRVLVDALVWGYGVRRWRMGLTIPRFFALNALAALCCTVLAVPIIMALNGTTGNGADDVIATIEEAVHSLWLAVASANIITSLADKTISGSVALLAVDVLPWTLVASMRPLMPLAGPRPEVPVRSSA